MSITRRSRGYTHLGANDKHLRLRNRGFGGLLAPDVSLGYRIAGNALFDKKVPPLRRYLPAGAARTTYQLPGFLSRFGWRFI